MEKEVCVLKHDNIDKILDNHEGRIDKLEISSATLTTQMKDMCNKLDKLIDALYDIIKSIVGGIIVLGIGFIIWYIQKS